MSEELTVEELVKTLRCCSGDINSCAGCQHEFGQICAQAADALESLTAERDGYKEQLKAALAENTRLAQQAVHAHWVKNEGNLYICSGCGHYCREFLVKQPENIPYQTFCTACGAKMDKQE